ncbi:MAG: DinB family protein [Chloroflexota bacterium]
MTDLLEIIHVMTANAEAVRALAQAIPAGQAEWKPNPDTWSMKEVMEHLYNEERLDFRRHIRDILEAPQQPQEYMHLANCQHALDGFMEERKASLDWLAALATQAPPDWQAGKRLVFGPDESITISAKEMLVSWVEHDFLHMRQMVELLHAWNAQRATSLALQYAGGW